MMTRSHLTYRLTVAAACLVFTTACSGGSAQAPGGRPSQANTMKTPDEAARKVIESLPQLVTAANFRSMGFSSLDEVKTARLGTPVPRRTVSYEQLLNYKDGTPVNSLFAGEDQMVYPIQAGDQVRTTAAISRRGDDWHISSVGDAYLAPVFATAGSNFEIVSIPGLNLEFAGIRQGDEWTLIPVENYPQLQFNRGARLESKQAMVVIAAHAREFDKLYGDQLRKRRLVK